MLVFRFEQEDGTGAYCNISYENHTHHTGHPGPKDDLTPELKKEVSETGNIGYPMGLLREKLGKAKYDSDDVIFGFASLKDAYKWFNKSEITEKQLPGNVFLSAYMIPEDKVIILKSQVVFDKNFAQKIN